MHVLQIIAHPDTSGKSFTGQLAKAFEEGAREAGHFIFPMNIFDSRSDHVDLEAMILEADHICFAWPCWWEMPPAKLVNLLQTVFVKDFAFELQGDRMRPKLNIPVSCLISMGQQKDLSTTNLREAMNYCGLHPMFYLFQNVGPRLSPELSESYLDMARRAGRNL